MPLGTWILLLAPSLIFVLIQTSAEEIVFRGYVQQQLAARFSSPLVWMVLPAVLFALGHYLPDTAGDNALMIAAWAGMFGILMADLTARAGTLGPAIAVHFWNNVSAILIVSLPDDLSGLALYLTPFGMNDTEALRAWLPVDFAMMIVLWLAARLAIRR
jgi:membrane protease YdiL (CAAX protease family)